MGLIIRNIHGKDFLVYLLEKEQLYIGPKGEYDKGKIEIVRQAIKHNDQKIDKVLQKYIEDVKELSNYLPESERKEYLTKRTAELLGRLRRLEEELQKIKSTTIAFTGTSAVVSIKPPTSSKSLSSSRSYHSPSLDAIKKKLEEKSRKEKKVKKTEKKK